MTRLTSILMMALALVIASACAGPSKRAPKAKVQSAVAENVEYRDGDQALEGFSAFDRKNGMMPAVVVVHDWMGIGEHTKQVCVELAKLGYYAFAADIYGQGVRPKNSNEAGALAGSFKNNPARYRQRLAAALAYVRSQPEVDTKNVAVTGYCFGGTGALEMARDGQSIKGAVSFHGGLGTPQPAVAGQVKAKVLVLHGADDPFVPAQEVQGFIKEMNAAEVDWQMIHYSDAVHSFTNPKANRKGAAEYNRNADKRSWQAMRLFLEEVFEQRE